MTTVGAGIRRGCSTLALGSSSGSVWGYATLVLTSCNGAVTAVIAVVWCVWLVFIVTIVVGINAERMDFT